MSTLLEQASLVLIPSGYKEDVVYSQIPTSGAGDLSFTRASNGTRVNSAGLVEVCPWNLQTYSEDFSNASWSKNNSPVMAYNVATAPNGTMTADSIQSNNASVYQSVGAQTQSVAPNSTVTLSLYIKKETSKTYFMGSYLYFTGGTTKLTYVLFDEVNGTMNIIAPDEVSMVTSVESVGDWWRFIITGTDTGGNTNLGYAFYGTLSQNGTSLSPGIGSVRTIWGAQLNIGSTAKPYFPTTDRLNVPRLTYQNGGGGCPSLLLEKQSTNILTYSEQFDNGDWLKYQCSISANQTTSPDGTQNADKLTLAGGSGTYRGLVYRLTTPGANSIFMKNDSIGNGKFYIQVDGIGNASWNSDGTLASVSGGTATNGENMGNGWFRFTYVCSGGAYINYGIENGTTGDSIFIWGAQVESSSYATSYIPTTSSSATRVADACSKTGISSLIGQTEGTIFVDLVITGTTGNNRFSISDGSNANWIFIGTPEDGATRASRFYIKTDNSVHVDVGVSSYFTIGQRYKLALAYKSGDWAVYGNGTLLYSGTNPIASVSSALSVFNFFNATSGNADCGEQINQAILFPTRLTNSELASLTTI